MIIHALNNGLILILVNKPEWFGWLKISMAETKFVPWSWTITAGAVMALGLWLIKPRTVPAPDNPV
jgi:hypothetical protein